MFAVSLFAAELLNWSDLPLALQVLIGLVVAALLTLLASWLTLRRIPNQQVGVVEKLWSRAGSIREGNIIALNGEAGYQVDLLRGGVHFGLWRWQYRVHKVPLVTIPQGKIGCVYARDGEPLPPSQTLGRVVPCNNCQDAHSFLGELGDRGEEAVSRCAASAAGNGPSCAKAFTPSTRRFLWSLPKTPSIICRTFLGHEKARSSPAGSSSSMMWTASAPS
jgi:hypothetical protein